MNGAAVTNSTPARSPGTRAASFASLATGWAVATVAWIVRSVHGPGFGYVTDFAFMVAWPAVFVTAAWFLLVVPALRLPSIARLLADPRTSWFAWPALALGAYVLLVMTWVDSAGSLAWFPALVGVVAGAVFPPLLRVRTSGRAVAAAPVAAALVFAFVIWPVLERVSPHLTYAYGADASRSRSLERILRRVRVGDPFEELADRYPRLFDTPTNAITGNSSAGGRAFTYRVEFDEVGGRVSAIEVERREAP